MSYYCLDCFNKIEGKELTYQNVECDMDICENCRKNKPCVAFVKNEVVNDAIYAQKYADRIFNIIGQKDIISINIGKNGDYFLVTLYLSWLEDYGAFEVNKSSTLSYLIQEEDDIEVLLTYLLVDEGLLENLATAKEAQDGVSLTVMFNKKLLGFKSPK